MTSPADNAGPTGNTAPNDKDVNMWDAGVLDAEGWNRMTKLFRAILDKTINTDSARERAVFIYSVIKQSKVFGEEDVFTTDMLKILKPEGIEIAFKKSKDKYQYKNVKDGKQCGGLSEEVFDSPLNVEAWEIVPQLGAVDANNDDGNVDSMADAMEFEDGEDEDNNKEVKYQNMINYLPKSDVMISQDVQTAQKAFFAQIKALYDKSPPMPDKLDQEKISWKAWISQVEKAQLKINEEIGTARDPPWGHIPLADIANLWSKSKRDDVTDRDKKEINQLMLGLWLRQQFPIGWRKLPPEEINTWPDQTQLGDALRAKNRLQERLAKEQSAKEARKMKPATQIVGTGLDSSAKAGQGQATNSAVNAFVHNTIHGALTDRTVPGPNQKQELYLASGRVEAGKLVGNSNKTEDGEPVVAWFNRDMLYKDDDDPQNKQAKNTFYYFVVQKNGTHLDKTFTFYEIVGEELCGGREMRKAVNQAQVPRVLELGLLKGLPTRKEITQITWGLEWCAAKRKYKNKKGLPNLIVCMWWKVENAGDHPNFKIMLNPEKLDRERQAKERRVVLARGHFNNLMGPRGDKMIMKAIPHPAGMAWTNVKECIDHFLKTVEA